MMNDFKASKGFAGIKVKAPAKINLHLEVLGLRQDGFHELAMVMQNIDLSDYLEITSCNEHLIRLTSDHKELSTSSDNIIVKAAELLRSRSGINDLGASIHLRKNIPIGAGLAGGSSDGAAALLGLNYFWNLSFSRKQLLEMAAELGSDVPFCFEGGSQICFGRGEKMEKISYFGRPMGILLVKDPLISVSTPWAYKRCKEIKGSNYFKTESDFESRRQKLREENWLQPLSSTTCMPLRNDLQEIVSVEVKAVSKALDLLSSIPGSLGVAMSGSGPSCFAIYSTYDEAKEMLEKFGPKFRESGLEVWCSAFQQEGVTLEK